MSTERFAEHGSVGRGLSRVQRMALSLAWLNTSVEAKRFTEGLEPFDPPDAYIWELLEKWKGWEPQVRNGDSAKYDREEIGHNEYHVAQSTAHRAVKLLEDRGLVVRRRDSYSSGYDLTDEGEEIAEKLAAG